MNYSIFATSYAGIGVLKEAYFGASYYPHQVSHRQLRLAVHVGNGNGEECIEHECDARQLLQAMDSLGHVKALAAVEFQQTEREDRWPGRYLYVLEQRDMFGLSFCINPERPALCVPKAEFVRFMGGVYRWLALEMPRKTGGGTQALVESTSGFPTLLLPERLMTPSTIRYVRGHSDDAADKDYELDMVFYPSTVMCSIGLVQGDITPFHLNVRRELSHEARSVLEAFQCGDKVSALETLDWIPEGAKGGIRMRASVQGETVEIECRPDRLLNPVCVVSRSELCCFLDGACDMLAAEMA